MIVESANEVLEHYETMRQEAVSRWNEGWFCHDLHSHERYKFLSFPSIEVLKNFRDYYIGGIGLEHSDRQIDMATHQALKPFEKLPPHQEEQVHRTREEIKQYLKVQFEKLVKDSPDLAGLWKFSAHDPDDFGGARIVIKFGEEKISVSPFSIRTASRTVNAILHLNAHQALKPDMSILELGGGFGRSLQMIAQPISAKTLYYVDLPVNLAVASVYFQRASDKPVNVVWTPEDECRQGSVNIIAPWLIDKLPATIDLMLNFLSMHHMPSETHEYYYQNLIKDRVRYLYHENRLEPRVASEGEGSLSHSRIRQAAQLLASEEQIHGFLYDSKGRFVSNIYLQKELLKY